jgi:TRAP-type uncharacterized transport system substrate-binding protein
MEIQVESMENLNARQPLVGARRLHLIAVFAAVLVIFLGLSAAQAQNAGAAAASGDATAVNGYAAHRPIFGGSCKQCPWGWMGEIVKQAMQPFGYDVQICYSCAGGPRETRLVAAAAQAPSPTSDSEAFERMLGLDPGDAPAPPNGAIDFGATTTNYLTWAYRGTHEFEKEGPKPHLRLLAVIPSPFFLVVGVRKDLGVHDLAQLKALKRPLRVLWDGPMWGDGSIRGDHNSPAPEFGDGWSRTVLQYYGLTVHDILAAGGEMRNGILPSERKDFDLVIYAGDQSAAPEFNVLSEVSQKYDLEFLALPDPLRDELAAKFSMQKRDLPAAFLRGVSKPVPTVAILGNVIYGRDDMPDDFAYALAKALDVHKDLWLWGYEHFAYIPDLVWKNDDVPLHPGAARYYSERHYMP